MANKPTFKQFLEMIYGLTLDDYNRMNYMQKQAVEIDYKD